uniref:MOB kinase activator 2 n=1 Tax=Rhinolophus ferrumequinum TaxID=59479 RepID=A0A671F3T7_RHIFE
MAECDTQCYWYEELGKKIKCTVCAPPSLPVYLLSLELHAEAVDQHRRRRIMKYSREFPSSFKSLVKICKYLLHMLAHIYSSQFRETLALKLHRHLNILYIHFILFAREFNLLGPQEIPIMYNLKEVLSSVTSNTKNLGQGKKSEGKQRYIEKWLKIIF